MEMQRIVGDVVFTSTIFQDALKASGESAVSESRTEVMEAIFDSLGVKSLPRCICGTSAEDVRRFISSILAAAKLLGISDAELRAKALEVHCGGWSRFQELDILNVECWVEHRRGVCAFRTVFSSMFAKILIARR